MTAIHIEGTLEIATGVPATFDKAGYEALTFIEISGLIEAPAFATTHTDINVPSLGGRTKILKGAEIGTASSIVYEDVDSDAGQAAVLAACRARGEYSLRWTPPESGADVTYASGILKDFAPNKPTNASYAGATCQFVPNYVPVTAAAPA
jgi:hypothetical protein